MKWQMKTKLNYLVVFYLVVTALLCSCATNDQSKAYISDADKIKIAMNYIDKEDYDAAYNILSAVEARDKNNFFAVYNIGVIHHSWGKFVEARSNYQKALEILDHSDFEAVVRLRYRRIIESNMAVLRYNK
jgi:Tfp pilus assembly protein PilF